LLIMLRKELDSFGSTKDGGPDELASLVEATMGVTSEKTIPAVVEAKAAKPTSGEATGSASGKSPQAEKPRGGRRLKGKGR
jgi:hypothetical protein